MELKEVTFDIKKFKELVLYIAEESSKDGSFGRTKLNKILFFSDFLAYGNWGAAITGATYERLQHGPVARQLPSVLEKMELADEAAVITVKRTSYKQERVVPKRQADLTVFSEREMALVKHVIERLKRRNTVQVSDLSHSYLGWQIAEHREVIPYQTVFLSNTKPTRKDHVRAQELACEHGWLDAV